MKASTVPPTLGVHAAKSARVFHRIQGRHFALLSGFVLILISHFVLVRPWYLNWGATPAEQSMALPGDQFVTSGAQYTHAISIDAPSSLVWKWVAQLGQDRGGFYSYDILENVIGAQMPTSDYLRPSKQNWKSGDKLWMYPASYNIPVTGAPLQTYVPGRAIGFATTQNEFGDSSWNFVLNPIDASHTRLLVRSRAPKEASLSHFAFNALVFDQAHFAMEKRMMIGIKELAEGGDRGRVANHMMVALWTITFALWVLSIVFTLRRKEWLRPFMGFLAASFLFQFLTFGQPSLWLGSTMVIALIWLLWRPASGERVSESSAGKAVASQTVV